jgi:hypothetical protein
MDIFGYFISAVVTLTGSVIVALAVNKVEDLYLEWKYAPLNVIPDQEEEEELITLEQHEEHH